MTAVRHVTLQELLTESGVLSPARAIAVIAPIAAAIDAAHANALLRRDVINPANIIVGADDEASLADTGLTGTDDATTADTALLAYVAPERLTRNAAVSVSTDVYALACVLFECLTGTAAYSSEVDLLNLTAYEQADIPVASRRRSGVPAGFDDVLAVGLAKDPADRYASAGDLVIAARRVLDDSAADTVVQPGCDAAQPESVPDAALASWPTRAGALAVDLLPGGAVVAAAALTAGAVPLWGPWWWGCVLVGGLATLAMAVNRCIRPVLTGASLGRAAFGATVVARDGASAGPLRLLMRDLLHLLDTLGLFLGWLWPLWDARRRTFADLLAKTEVRVAQRAGSRRWWAGLVATATVLCATAAAIGYFQVYQPDRQWERARHQLALQGPTIVAEMLSFDPKTLAQDFTHAQSLATESYREQLILVQRQVQQKPTRHTYWVPNSAVLSATADRGEMLMFLQGQVGEGPNVQPATTTVRAGFVRTADRWLVDQLTFVLPPKRAEAGR